MHSVSTLSSPCSSMSMSLPIQAYSATNPNCVSLKYGHTLHMIFSHLQTTGSYKHKHSTEMHNYSVTLWLCTIAFVCIIISLMHSLRLTPKQCLHSSSNEDKNKHKYQEKCKLNWIIAEHEDEHSVIYYCLFLVLWCPFTFGPDLFTAGPLVWSGPHFRDSLCVWGRARVFVCRVGQ